MMNYNECNIIEEYVRRNDFKELYNYLNLQRKLFYNTNARKALKKYLWAGKNDSFYGYTIDDKLLIANLYSAFLLNSDEILSENYIKNMKKQPIQFVEQKIETVCQYIQGYSLVTDQEVVKIKISSKDNNVYMYSKNNILSTFDFNMFNYCSYFLGENIEYKISDQNRACIATSKKGKALLLGKNL